jgi:hypothetical protein
MKPHQVILAYALVNIAIAATLFYLWESSAYTVSLSEAISGTNTLRFWLFISGVVGIFIFAHFYSKETK